MYNEIIKPILFKVGIERAHRWVTWLLRFAGHVPLGLAILRRNYRIEHPSLERDVFGIKFRNPIGLAAGFDINGEMIKGLDALGFGFIEIGALSPEPQSGNPKPRIYRLPKDRAIVQRMGHPNRGLQFAVERLRRGHEGVIVGCNIAPNRSTEQSDVAKDYLKCFRNLYQYVDYFTVNISFKSLVYDENTMPQMAIRELLSQLFDFRRGQSDYRPILIKVSPDLSDEMIDAVTDVLVTTPLDGVVACYGTHNRKGLETSELNAVRIGAGRLSGEPLRKRACEVVRRIYNRSGGAYPIIGVGGISSAEDVKAMLDAGASLVQMFSGFVYDGPSAVREICNKLIEE